MSEMRTVAQRKAGVVEVLERQGHMWLATAHGDVPHVSAASALGTGDELVVTTVGSSRTGTNRRGGAAALLVAGTQDDAVVVLARVAESRPAADSPDLAARWKEAMGWDPRDEGDGWWFYRLTPVRIQAFRGYGEIAGRDVMRDSRWLA